MMTDRLKEAEPNPDVGLARAAGAGDPDACRVVAERLFDRTRATVHYLCAGDRDADDLAQQSLVAVLKSCRTFRGDCSLERWADRIVIRTTLREIKRRRWRERIVALEEDPLPDQPENQDQRLQRRLIRRHLARVLAKLSEDRRTAVTLHWVHGYSVSEIAEMTDSPVNTVRDRLRVGKKQLRKQLMKDPALADWARSVLHEAH